MSIPHSPPTTSVIPKPFSRPFNVRTAAMLLGFAAIICATVIAADWFSPRDRSPHVAPATLPSGPRP